MYSNKWYKCIYPTKDHTYTYTHINNTIAGIACKPRPFKIYDGYTHKHIIYKDTYAIINFSRCIYVNELLLKKKITKNV